MGFRTLMVAVGLLCAACESHGMWRPTSSGTDTIWWTEELSALQIQYLGAIRQKCLPAGVGYEGCMKERVAESLSPNGEAEKHCTINDSLRNYVDCMDHLTTAARAYEAFGVDPHSNMDWTDPIDAISDASQLMATELIKQCQDSSERTCIAREISYRFAVDPAEADRCASLFDQTSQIRCALGLSMMEKYRSALLYVG
jgi:hypothetical protein